MVEMALMAPVLIMLLLITYDVGRAFIAWVALNNAAREGAFLASKRFQGDTATADIQDVVAGESGEIEVLPTYVTVAYPTTTPGVPGEVSVTASYPFDPISPLVDSMWGEDVLWISAQASFPVPVRTPTPGP
jgi:Flp pilus assembly protein TadG